MNPEKSKITMPQNSLGKLPDAATIDAIIRALYDVISGNAGTKRDWNRLRSLFVPDGRMIKLVSKGDDANFKTLCLTIDGYIETSGGYIEKYGFFESEIARKTEQFGNLAHVFSTYECRHKINDKKPFMSGTNSLQLMHDGTCWRIINLVWENEQRDNLPPEK